MFVVVTGPPASGKSTVSTLLAQELGLPRFAKDTIKRGLLESLGAGDVAESRRVGAAAVQALLALAIDNPGGAVLDSVWVAPDSVRRLEHLPGPVVEVFCACRRPELRRRYRERAAEREGRPYDFDLERPEDELWNERSLLPLAGDWPVLTVDTEAPYDVPVLARLTRGAADAGSSSASGSAPAARRSL